MGLAFVGSRWNVQRHRYVEGGKLGDPLNSLKNALGTTTQRVPFQF